MKGGDFFVLKRIVAAIIVLIIQILKNIQNSRVINRQFKIKI